MRPIQVVNKQMPTAAAIQGPRSQSDGGLPSVCLATHSQGGVQSHTGKAQPGIPRAWRQRMPREPPGCEEWSRCSEILRGALAELLQMQRGRVPEPHTDKWDLRGLLTALTAATYQVKRQGINLREGSGSRLPIYRNSPKKTGSFHTDTVKAGPLNSALKSHSTLIPLFTLLHGKTTNCYGDSRARKT